MEYINLKQYINKQTGDILEAIDWNNLHTTLQSKINEIIGACNDISSVVTNSGITLGEITINGNKISASGHGESLTIEYASSVEKDKIELIASDRRIGGAIKTSITPAQIQIANPDNSNPFVQLSTNGLSLVDTNNSAIYTQIKPGEATIGNHGTNTATINENVIKIGRELSQSSVLSSMENNKIEVLSRGSYTGTRKTSITPTQIQVVDDHLAAGPDDPVEGTLSITPSGISKETEGGTLKIDSKHNALWLHGGSDSSVLDGQDITIGAGNKITLDANNGVEITSSKIDLLSDAIGVNGNNGVTTSRIQIQNGEAGYHEFEFKNGILTFYGYTESSRPFDPDSDENQ